MATRDVVTPVGRALRPHVSHPREIAAVVLSTSVKRGIPPRGGGRKKGGARVILLSRRKRTARVVAPRNAAIRWTRVFTEAASAALLVSTIPVSPVYLGLAGLVIVGQLRSLATKELDERHGAVVYVLWRRRGHEISQRLEMVLPEVNAELRRLGKPKMGKREFRDKMEQLTALGCLTPTLLGWRLKDRVWLTT
jgi:hypothetical protein